MGGGGGWVTYTVPKWLTVDLDNDRTERCTFCFLLRPKLQGGEGGEGVSFSMFEYGHPRDTHVKRRHLEGRPVRTTHKSLLVPAHLVYTGHIRRHRNT